MSMDDRQFNRFLGRIDRLNLEQSEILLEALQEHMEQKKRKPQKQIVRQIGYTEKQMQNVQMEAVRWALDDYNRFNQERLLPYLRAATNLLQIRHNISDNINHPRATLETNAKYLATVIDVRDGKEFTFLDMFTNAMDRAERTELALDETLNRETDRGDEPSLLGECALIRQELIKLEAAVHDENESRQEKAIDEIKALLLKTPSKAMLRQIEMRSEMNFGGNVKGMKLWRIELAREWVEIEKNNPDMTPGEIIEKLLEVRHTVITEPNGRKQFVAKNPDSRKEEKQIATLKSNRRRAVKYRHDLLEAYRKQSSDLTP